MTHPATDWLGTWRRYLLASAVLHLAWEVLQLPLYTIWRGGSAGEIAFAVAHCTGGDLMIAGLSLLAALLLVGHRDWPAARFFVVMAATVAVGAGYTVYSEWLNTVVRKSWAYSELMPVVPLVGTGLSPLLQWLVVPVVALRVAARSLRGALQGGPA